MIHGAKSCNPAAEPYFGVQYLAQADVHGKTSMSKPRKAQKQFINKKIDISRKVMESAQVKKRCKRPGCG